MKSLLIFGILLCCFLCLFEASSTEDENVHLENEELEEQLDRIIRERRSADPEPRPYSSRRRSSTSRRRSNNNNYDNNDGSTSNSTALIKKANVYLITPVVLVPGIVYRYMP